MYFKLVFIRLEADTEIRWDLPRELRTSGFTQWLYFEWARLVRSWRLGWAGRAMWAKLVSQRAMAY